MDTHTWLWITTRIERSDRLSPNRKGELAQAATDLRLYASDASVWELAMKQSHGQLLAIGDLAGFLDEQSRGVGVHILPLSAEVIIASTRLPRWIRRDGREHRDPADRFLVATARIHALTLVTADEVILAYAKQGYLRAIDARA